MELVFWLSIAWLVYVYVGYPLLVWCLAKLRRSLDVQHRMDGGQPTVTVVTAAFNEADCIGETIQNKLDSDYPSELLDVIVVSDESTDGTDDIVSSFGDRVTLIRQIPREGKTAGLNKAIAQTDSDIIVFADANSIYAPDAISRLVETFRDESVGYVTGKMVYVQEDGSMIGDGCSAYMRYENFIRAQETRAGSVIGVDGGIDATRRSLYLPMRADQQPDFVQPLGILERGYRVAFQPLALLKEESLAEAGSEYRMRVRVSLRALWALCDKRTLLNPLRYGFTSLQVWSHKVLRYAAFVPLLAALVSGAILATQSPMYLALFVGQLACYGIGVLGLLKPSESQPALVALCAYFLLINIAAAHAFARMLKGERQALWKPRAG